jgi:hypothetical protein
VQLVQPIRGAVSKVSKRESLALARLFSNSNQILPLLALVSGVVAFLPFIGIPFTDLFLLVYVACFEDRACTQTIWRL